MEKESGQVVIILLLTMLVALTIGLGITQRSTTDLSTSTQTEQSSRAFSAAEAGIEQALNTNAAVPNFDLGNQSKADVGVNSLPGPGQALEYPPIGKETIAQFWLVNPDNFVDSSYDFTNRSFELYFGNSNLTSNDPETPAIEINVVVKDGTDFISRREYYDPLSARSGINGFFQTGVTCGAFSPIQTSFSEVGAVDRYFRCKVGLNFNNYSNSGIKDKRPYLLRVRILYSNGKHPISLKSSSIDLPHQATLFTSTGTSGQSKKVLKVFKLKNVVPQILDFSIFSAAGITKSP